MSSTPPSGGMVFIEPLESRIAPTGLFSYAGDPTDPKAASDPHYVTYQTAPTATSLGFVKASVYLGSSAPANLYAIKLTGDGTTDATTGASTGDELVVFNNVTGFNLAVPLIQANKGAVVAFFLDDPTRFSNDLTHVAGQVYADELVGVSVGTKAAFTVNGNVHGDIVTNLLNGGNTVSLTSIGKPRQNIDGLTMNGNVFGDILAGGTIKNVDVVGSVNNVLAGTAANGVPYDFSGGTAGPTGTITNNAVSGHQGSNINQVTVTALDPNGVIQAGDGGFGAVGGAVTNIRVEADTDAFKILSGAGGDGNSVTQGGVGGAVGQVIVRGAAGTTPNSQILIQAGHGGNNSTGHGGTGGAVNGLAIGYNDDFDFTNNTGTVSADLLMQDVVVHGGDGGSGIHGGNGGAVNNAQVSAYIPDDGVIGADGTPNAEIQVFGGAGGVATSVGRGKGGHGGNIAQLTAQNLDVDAAGLNSSILVQGGLGGAAKGGGNITNLDLLGTILTVNGGDGGGGVNKGGGGGSLGAVVISNLTNLYAHQVTLNGGIGGDASNGHGGGGGNVSGIQLTDADLTNLSINAGTHANGGRGGNGVGGAGGSVGAGDAAGVDLFNSAPSGGIGTVSVRTGQGGDGTAGGGAGGSVDTLQLLGVDFSFSVAASAGGNTLGQGNGGVGGSVMNVGITNAPITPTTLNNFTPLSGAVGAGSGGVGNGAGGLGGKGGDLAAVNVRGVYNVALGAGNAGNGGAGAGTGGAINGVAATSLQGGVFVAGGSGALSSGSASDGGSITGLIAAAGTDISITAGNGGSGGSGGSIMNSGTTLNELTGTPNVGNLNVAAGNGSSQNGTAGSGGMISVFDGFVADGSVTPDGVSHTAMTTITAGAGGGGTTSTASGHGGGIDTVNLTGTSKSGEIDGVPITPTVQVVTLDGGNAGVAGDAGRGRAGGGVTNVTLYNLDEGTIIQHIAAGDGATGLRKGGIGGNVSQVHVGVPGDVTADIGIRSGVAYGYAVGGAGGIFAGIGGLGGKHSGSNGSVTDITANAIASIVAGKGQPQLCTVVDRINLDGENAPMADATGAFINFDTANMVGSVQDPTAPGATTYKQGDGLVAAANLLAAGVFTNRNFTPEATLTNIGNVLALADYLEQNVALNVNPIVISDPAPAFLG